MRINITLFDGMTSDFVARTLSAEIVEGSERQQHSQLDRCVRLTESLAPTNLTSHEQHFIEINTEEIPELIRALFFMHQELKLYEDSLPTSFSTSEW